VADAVLKLTLPAGVERLLGAVRDAGGRPFVVGGAVRDALLGRPVKDYDVEVYGLPAPRLEAELSAAGRMDAVGQAFTVYKVSGLDGLTGAIQNQAA